MLGTGGRRAISARLGRVNVMPVPTRLCFFTHACMT